MDELTLLRELQGDVPGPTAGADRAGRDRLDAEIRRSRASGAPARVPRSRRRWRARAITAGALAIAVGAVMLVLDAGRQAQPDPPALRLAGAKQVLRHAALRSAAVGAAPIPRDDQYVYTKEIMQEGTRVFIDENWRSVDGSRPSRISERGRSWISPPPGPNVEMWPPASYAKLASLPTEPRALLRAVALRRHDATPTLTAENYDIAYESLIFLLHGWRVMPPGLQAAAFDALALIPGVEIVDDDVDARGRHGYGIRRTGDSLDWTLILDRKTYDYIGIRDGKQIIALVDSGVVDRIGERPDTAADEQASP